MIGAERLQGHESGIRLGYGWCRPPALTVDRDSQYALGRAESMLWAGKLPVLVVYWSVRAKGRPDP